MPESTAPRPIGGDIHRLLDEAFAGVVMTPETQDLKEEVRANLVARVSELEASGVTAPDAAHQAIAELGDVSELVGESAPTAPTGSTPASWAAHAAAQRLGRVRPKPGFVVRVVVYSVAVAAALALVALSAFGVLTVPWGVLVLVTGIAATGVGLIVGDSLSQETTTNHPMPQARASGYALASFLTVWGLCLGGLIAVGALALWAIVFAAIGLVAGIVLFAFLGATQTNRHKAWVKRAQAEQWQVGNRFEEEPETAARFGIYTAVIWIVSFAAFVVLGFAIGWLWSWLALLGGFVVMMLTLARMLFGPRKG